MSFVALLWILLNIASTLSPFELQAGFCYWSIVLPNHEAFPIHMTIWTVGAHSQVYRKLQIMFGWCFL